MDKDKNGSLTTESEEKKKPQFRVANYSITNDAGRGLVTVGFVSVDKKRTPEDFAEFVNHITRWCAQ